LKYVRGLFFATFISLMIASIFSFFPKAEWVNSRSADQADKPVFIAAQPIELTTDNLVSFFKQLPTVYPFHKVKLDETGLFIDSKMNADHRFQEEDIYHDSYQLLKHLYRNTTNVENIYLRFLFVSEERPVLVLSVRAQRADVEQQLDSIRNELETEQVEQFLKINTHIEYGTGWRK
jgi:hypothetical protein